MSTLYGQLMGRIYGLPLPEGCVEPNPESQGDAARISQWCDDDGCTRPGAVFYWNSEHGEADEATGVVVQLDDGRRHAAGTAEEAYAWFSGNSAEWECPEYAEEAAS